MIGLILPAQIRLQVPSSARLPCRLLSAARRSPGTIHLQRLARYRQDRRIRGQLKGDIDLPARAGRADHFVEQIDYNCRKTGCDAFKVTGAGASPTSSLSRAAPRPICVAKTAASSSCRGCKNLVAGRLRDNPAHQPASAPARPLLPRIGKILVPDDPADGLNRPLMLAVILPFAERQLV